ncbi:MAG: hypothetical protein ACR2KG_05490 [Nocardioidaceae bacterium]
MTAAEVAAIFSGVSALAAILTGLVALWALQGTRYDSRERTRPVIVAELSDGPLADGTQMLLIRNFGQSVATDVDVAFDPPLTAAGDTNPPTNASIITARYRRPIPIFAPGMMLSNVYRAVTGPEAAEPAPDRVRVHVAYLGPGKRRYEDTFDLDVSLLRQVAVPAGSDEDNRRQRQIKALEAVAGALWKR